MKVTTLLILFSLAAIAPVASYATDTVKIPYPTTRGSEMVEFMPSLDGHTLAVEVQVKEVAAGAYGKPYIRTAFADGTDTLWLAPVVDPSGSIEVGDIIRVMGYVASIEGTESASLKSINPSGYHLLVICYYNFRTKHGLFFPFKSEPNQCSRWRDGDSSGR
jgi:hypothetical protein